MCIYVNTFIICLHILLYVKKGPHFIKQFSVVTNNFWLQMTLASTHASFRNQHDPGKKEREGMGREPQLWVVRPETEIQLQVFHSLAE